MTAAASIGDASRLRQWASRAFRADPDSPPVCSPNTWRLFLSAERCALPLRERLRVTGRYDRLDGFAQSELGDASRAELQRVLSARAQLQSIARLAQENGWKVVVLKGGLHVWSDRDALDLVDVDVLTSPTDAPRLAAALDAAGFRGFGFGSDQHLKSRIAAGTVPIEVHTVADPTDTVWSAAAWDRAVELAETAGLWALSPADHLWHVLTHVVVRHPYRRGAIRDLLLIGHAAAHCSTQELNELAARAERHRYSGALRRVLHAARSLVGGEVVADDFAWLAAAGYYLRARGERVPVPAVIKSDAGKWAVALLCGTAELGHMAGWVTMGSVDRSYSRPIAWVEGRSARIGRAVRVAARLLRHSLALLVAAPLAVAAAGAAHRAVRSLPSLEHPPAASE